MNYLYISILSIAVFIIIGLGIKLAVTKHTIKKRQELAAKHKQLLEKRDHDIMEDTAKILEKFPPANGPEPIKEPDYDNQYSTENTEELVIAEKDELTELSENIDEVDTHGNVITAATDKLGIIASKPIPVEGVIDEESLKTIGEAVAALEPKKTKTKTKKTTKKTKKKSTKKTSKKATKKVEVKVEEKPKRKYTKKAKVTE